MGSLRTLMVDCYTDETEANSFQRAKELAAQGINAGRLVVAIEQCDRPSELISSI